MGDDSAEAETYHNNFQDADHFLTAGGLRGRQLQVLVEGTYYVNRLFATVEMIPKTIIEVGTVGVVVSYTGEIGADLSGDGLPPRRTGLARATAACGANRSCPASTPSTPMPARCRPSHHQHHPEVDPQRGRLAPALTRT